MDVTTSRAVKTVRITKLPCNLTHTQFYIRFCCPFSFTLSASDCCLLEIFIQSLAEIQLLVTRNIARNRIKPFSASSQSYSKCRREKNNMSRTRGKEVEWEQENGKFISPNTLFYPHSLAPPPGDTANFYFNTAVEVVTIPMGEICQSSLKKYSITNNRMAQCEIFFST